jgi:hypothetical protein
MGENLVQAIYSRTVGDFSSEKAEPAWNDESD